MNLLAVAGIVLLTVVASAVMLWAISRWAWWRDAYGAFLESFDLRDAYDAAAEAAGGPAKSVSRKHIVAPPIAALCPRCEALHAIDVRRQPPVIANSRFDAELAHALVRH